MPTLVPGRKHQKCLELGFVLIAGMPTAWAADFIYTVQPGDHPWNLAQRYLKRPAFSSRLLHLNQIADDHRLMPGTRLRIPQEWIKLQSAQVHLLAVYGETSLGQGSGPPRAAVPGELLQANAVLRTGASGSATLGFADDSRVLLGHDSELRMTQARSGALGGASVVELVLLQGSLENQITPVGNTGGRFEIQTPAAVAAVRGTNFRVRTQRQQLHTEVLNGTVAVSNARGKANAGAGQGLVTENNQPPGQVMALLPAPSLDGIPERVQRLPIDLPLPGLAGAVAYRTQLAPDASFSVVVSDETSSAPRLRARDLPDGNYILRVRAADAQGLEGHFSQRALTVQARPEPPLLIAPTASAVTELARPMFRWTQAQPHWRYRLQITDIASGTSQDEQVVDSDVSPLSQRELPAGQYSWRVAAIDPVKGQGPWGDGQMFRRVLPGPGVTPTEAVDGELNLHWSAQPQSAHYHLQVGPDEAFATPQVDAQTDLPQYHLSGLAAGAYQVRVRAVGTDGYVGPWGSTQRFVVPQAQQPWWSLVLVLAVIGLL
jgi:hypothetical protein